MRLSGHCRPACASRSRTRAEKRSGTGLRESRLLACSSKKSLRGAFGGTGLASAKGSLRRSSEAGNRWNLARQFVLSSPAQNCRFCAVGLLDYRLSRAAKAPQIDLPCLGLALSDLGPKIAGTGGVAVTRPRIGPRACRPQNLVARACKILPASRLAGARLRAGFNLVLS